MRTRTWTPTIKCSYLLWPSPCLREPATYEFRIGYGRGCNPSCVHCRGSPRVGPVLLPVS